MNDKKYAEGIYYNLPRKGAPEYVIGSVSFKKEQFLTWLTAQKENQAGYVNVDVLQGKEKPYCKLNEYQKPTNVKYEEPQRNKREEVTHNEVDLDSVPF